jgi:hypothetical protein
MPHHPSINSQTFHELNQRYFAGRLPRYQVIVAPHLRHAVGKIARRSRRLYIAPTAPDIMLQTLVHEMAHAATNDRHGPKWQAEMERLRALGAPAEVLEHLDALPRLTRSLVLEIGLGAYYDHPALTALQVAQWIQHEYGFAESGTALLRKYPWVRRALHDARQHAAEYRARREQQLATQNPQ